jgi:hypothetical protein
VWLVGRVQVNQITFPIRLKIICRTTKPSGRKFHFENRTRSFEILTCGNRTRSRVHSIGK